METAHAEPSNIAMTVAYNDLKVIIGPMVKSLVRAEVESRDQAIINLVNHHSALLKGILSRLGSAMRVQKGISERLDRMDHEITNIRAETTRQFNEATEWFSMLHDHCCKLDREIDSVSLSVQNHRQRMFESIKSSLLERGNDVMQRRVDRDLRCKSFTEKFIRRPRGSTSSDERLSHKRKREHDYSERELKRERIPGDSSSSSSSHDDVVDGSLVRPSHSPPPILETSVAASAASAASTASAFTTPANTSVKTTVNTYTNQVRTPSPRRARPPRPPMTGGFVPIATVRSAASATATAQDEDIDSSVV